jgi:hypothetical protein
MGDVCQPTSLLAVWSPAFDLLKQHDLAIAFDAGFVPSCGVSYNNRIPGCPVKEVRLATLPNVGDHRRRILEHQEKVEAEQRTLPVLQRSEPQLQIPLIGEVRRPEPPAPKRKRRGAKTASQPDLGKF